MKRRNRRSLQILSATACLLTLLVSGCDQSPPPQAMTLNATYVEGATFQAQASETVEATRTPGETLVPTDTPTPSIVEVTVEKTQVGPEATATPCPATAICEIGPLLTPPPPGDVQIEPGTYTPEWRQSARKCESVSCDTYGLITAGVTLQIEGYVVDENGWWWLCGEVLIDEGPGGAETCDHAMVWLSLGPEGKRWGEWISK